MCLSRNHSRTGVRDVWSDPSSTHSFSSPLPSHPWRQPFHNFSIVLTTPIFPAHPLTLTADDLTSHFTADRRHHSIVTCSYQCYKTTLNSLYLSHACPPAPMGWVQCPYTYQRQTPPLASGFPHPFSLARTSVFYT